MTIQGSDAGRGICSRISGGGRGAGMNYCGGPLPSPKFLEVLGQMRAENDARDAAKSRAVGTDDAEPEASK